MADIPPLPYILSGQQSQRLRTYCTSNSWNPSDLDTYAQLLTAGNVSVISSNFDLAVSQSNVEAARQSIAAKNYGPTKLPVYNFLLQLMTLKPGNRERYIAIIRYLALTAKVPVDSMDLSGNTTFMWAISTKPYYEPEIASIMLEAGAKINHRNRYGCTAAHDFVMLSDYSPGGINRALAALKFFLDNGGDLDIKDGDGVSARKILGTVSNMVRALKRFCKEEEEGVPRCGKCNAKKHESGRDLMSCGRCQVLKYCSGECQKADWKKHKGECKKVEG